MNKRVLTALQRSIRKWKQIAAGKAVSYGTDNCALCRKFHPEYNMGKNSCEGCPVREVTGQDECLDTPFSAWQTHLHNSHKDRFEDAVQPGCELCVDIALAEYNFLRALLPKKLRKAQ